MHIEKIEVPAFRALRDVVIECGAEYRPSIFPIGSENGGGKSTLLQLVFTLLHCSAYEERLPYLRNTLASEHSDSEEAERTIARITVRHGELYELEFISLGGRFLIERLPEPPQHGFHTDTSLEASSRSVDEVTVRLQKLEEASAIVHSLPPEREVPNDRTLREIFARYLPEKRMPSNALELRGSLGRHIKVLERELADTKERVEVLKTDSDRLNGLLVSLN